MPVMTSQGRWPHRVTNQCSLPSIINLLHWASTCSRVCFCIISMNRFYRCCIVSADVLSASCFLGRTEPWSSGSTRPQTAFTTICPAGIYCGLLLRVLQAAFSKHFQGDAAISAACRSLTSASFSAVITVAVPRPSSPVTKRGRKQSSN